MLVGVGELHRGRGGPWFGARGHSSVTIHGTSQDASKDACMLAGRAEPCMHFQRPYLPTMTAPGTSQFE